MQGPLGLAEKSRTAFLPILADKEPPERWIRVLADLFGEPVDLWLDWIRVVLNSPGDLTYSLANVPYLLAPVVAWTGRVR